MNKKFLNTLDDAFFVSEGEMKLIQYIDGQSGPFNKALFETILHADCLTLNRLDKVFSEEVSAVRRYKSEPTFVEEVRARLSRQ